MERAPRNRARGFTLIELLVAMALGLLVMGAMASLFKTGLNAMMLVTQRTETQRLDLALFVQRSGDATREVLFNVGHWLRWLLYGSTAILFVIIALGPRELPRKGQPVTSSNAPG